MLARTPQATELAPVEIGGMTRGAFVVRGALATGALYGVGAVGPYVAQAFGQDDDGDPEVAQGDLDVLNFALTLEILEAAFYEQALERVPDLSGEVRELTIELDLNEAEHVVALTEAVRDFGGEPVRDLELDFGDAFNDERSYLKLAQVFEDTGVGAYNGAAARIMDKDVLALAGTIVQIEGRHAALVRMLRGEDPAPSSLDLGIPSGRVMDMVAPFIRGAGQA